MKTKAAGPLVLLAGSLALSMALARGDFRSTQRGGLAYQRTEVRGNAFPKVLATGTETHELMTPPRRIASLTTTSDDIVTSLVDPSRIVAVTPFADDPIVSISAGHAPASALRVRGADPEALIAARPDVVFVAHYTLDSGTRLLSAARIPVVRLAETDTLEDVFTNLRTIASALGEDERGALIAEQTRTALEAVQRAVRGRETPRVLYYSGAGYTAGTGTLVDARILLSGGRNVAREAGLSGFAHVSLDLLVALNPEVILLPHWTRDETLPIREILESPVWRDVAAVRTGRVYAFPAAVLTSESPAGLLATELVARKLHPEAFR